MRMNNMHTRSVSLAITLILALSPLVALADTSVSVAVPNHCTVTDTDGVAHTYSGQYLGICALEAALEAGSISGAEFSNAFPSLCLFVTSIGGTAADPTSQYWALYQNDGFASVGLSQMTVAADDTIMLELHDFSDNYLGTRFPFPASLIASTPSVSASATGASSLTLHDPFDISLALSYLAANQSADGSFDSSLTSDWAAIAFSSGGAGDALKKMQVLFASTTPELLSVTDYERHAMALEALGIDPYAAGGVDYIAPVLQAFDGTQIGNSSLVNDDIFALFPLLHAGYATSDGIIGNTVTFILSKQKDNGSWEESVDLTAAAIQALAGVRSLSGVDAALQKATGYLRAEQNEDGGWGNSFTTSWVLQALQALGDSPYDWTKSVYQTPRYYLATFQERDGGVEPVASDTATRVWATAYAIPATKGKTWNDVLKSFPKPTPAASTTAVAASSLGRSPTGDTLGRNPSVVDEPAGPTGEATPKIDMTLVASSSDDAVPVSSATEPETAIKMETPQATPSITPQLYQEEYGPGMTTEATDSPQSAESGAQTAAATNAPTPWLWSSIVSLFAWLF